MAENAQIMKNLYGGNPPISYKTAENSANSKSVDNFPKPKNGGNFRRIRLFIKTKILKEKWENSVKWRKPTIRRKPTKWRKKSTKLEIGR